MRRAGTTWIVTILLFSLPGSYSGLTLTGSQAEGRAIWESVCWSCHGTSGQGNGPAVQRGAIQAPPNLHEGAYPRLSTSELVSRFEELLQGTADPSRPHMTSVLSFLDEESFRTALSYVPAMTYPDEIPGSALVGRDMYEFRCMACHGDEGRGDGPAASDLAVAPADFTADTLLAAGNFQGVFERIRDGGGPVHGSAMPPWGRIFSDADIWNLVAYVATLRPGTVETPRSRGGP